jgi:hypothetical protein
VTELPLVIQADPERRLQSCLTGGGPILLRGAHGAAENPLVILTLMHHLGVRILALEWPPDLEPTVQRYLEGDVLDFRMFERSSDGRITAGQLAVLRELHDGGSLERLVLFDAPAPIAGVVADTSERACRSCARSEARAQIALIATSSRPPVQDGVFKHGTRPDRDLGQALLGRACQGDGGSR